MSKMVKESLFLLENLIFLCAIKVTENHRKNLHDRACEGPGSIPGLMSQIHLLSINYINMHAKQFVTSTQE